MRNHYNVLAEKDAAGSDEFDLMALEATPEERHLLPSDYWQSRRGRAVAALLKAQGKRRCRKAVEGSEEDPFREREPEPGFRLRQEEIERIARAAYSRDTPLDLVESFNHTAIAPTPYAARMVESLNYAAINQATYGAREVVDAAANFLVMAMIQHLGVLSPSIAEEVINPFAQEVHRAVEAAIALHTGSQSGAKRSGA
jgi:hypothetical protein